MCIKFIDTTEWFIEASRTADHLNNVMIILPMHCIVLKQSSGWVITCSRSFEEEALNPRENYFNFRRKIENVECDTCFNAFLKWCTSLRRQRGV